MYYKQFGSLMQLWGIIHVSVAVCSGHGTDVQYGIEQCVRQRLQQSELISSGEDFNHNIYDLS